ncbi:MFS transporter [Methylococcus capsulatus]|uniref:Major facilitator family transporter n=1 Tax=Methylococcus capsulatus (strain ATCC 33009 / NCIMB 11132 / Bath) TaxID=243233 RepID=Q603V5_METCA|nr:MFS transporter [Methylococcus capsulatus]AAU91262.1 major facilitator family transporter [Methylococcus capsulatus str. Bath]QXP89028.1 MFS transporter [Methylococcus capsulatus]QXP95224.1 MFS transporter [Methylococcus capsulatus]UQN13687.1 MFS transporter [Methylococcus capsulatus]
MTRTEIRAATSLAAIYMFRMLGLFMILPVFSIYARDLPGATPVLIGLAISAYGLTQAVFQIPFGIWSDRFGRKPLIVIGLLMFAGGSVMAAVADSIYGIVAGRALQGAGAVAGVIMALAADLTQEEHRTKAMALIGVSIGISFAFSMVAGPVLSGWIGVRGIFWSVAGLALLGIAVLYSVVPTPQRVRFHRDTEAQPARFSSVLTNPELVRLDFGIFALHAILTATFVVLPLILRDELRMDTPEHWKIYLPVFVLSMISMVPFVIVAEKKRQMKPVFLSFILLTAAVDVILAGFTPTTLGIGLLLYLFFTAFNLLEATLPSMVSKVAPADLKGTAMGVYSTTQFLGAFVGGAGAGWIQGHHGIPAVFLFCAGIALLWLAVAFGMQKPRHLSSLMVNLGEISASAAADLSARLRGVPGIADAVVVPDEGVAYLKVERERLDRSRLEALLNETAGA